MEFYKPKETLLYSNMWISSVPCKINKIDDNKYNVTSYDLKRQFTINKSYLLENFLKITVNQDFIEDFTTTLFDKNKVMDIINKKINISDNIKKNILRLIEKIFQDSYNTVGDIKTVTIIDYLNKKDKSKLVRFSPYFNRRSRHCCVVPNNYDIDKFNLEPKPLGIRQIDYATKKEQNNICKTLLIQLFTFENSPPMPLELQEYLNITINQNNLHKCRYCNKTLDITKISQKYSDTTTYLNLCHDEPQLGTIATNLYLGHTKCNREQGGYSINERILQGLNHLNLKDEINDDIKSQIKIILNKFFTPEEIKSFQ